MLFAIFLLIIGLIALGLGGEVLIRGAVGLAERTSMSRMLIGLTIVSIGTSAPEFAISAYAAWLDKTDIVVGNVIGSNIFNILFALGLSAAIIELRVKTKAIKFYIPSMIIISAIAYAFAYTGTITIIHGIILLIIFAMFNILLMIYEKKSDEEIPVEEVNAGKHTIFTLCVFIVIGLALLTVGSKSLVVGASDLARMLHVSELIISITIVAIGTSLPEAVAAIAAAKHGEFDLAVGNIIGSNIINISGVLGLSALFAPNGVHIAPDVFDFDLPVMLAASIACLPIFYTGNKISRIEGCILVGYYFLFMLDVILRATEHEYLPYLHHSILYFFAPLTILTFTIYVYREKIKRH